LTYDALRDESHLSGFRWVKVIGKVRTMESMGIYPGCLEACAGGFALAGELTEEAAHSRIRDAA
jgi:hypothetical protein